MCDPNRGGHSMVGCHCPCCSAKRTKSRLAAKPHVPGTRLHLSVTPRDRARIKALAKRLGCTMSVAVRVSVRHYEEATA